MSSADWGILIAAVAALITALAGYLQAQTAKGQSKQNKADIQATSVGLVNTHDTVGEITELVPAANAPEPLPSNVLRIANGIVRQSDQTSTGDTAPSAHVPR